MQTKEQRRTQRKYKDFISLIESVSEELYSKAQWDEARAEPDCAFMALVDMETHVYETAYARQPDAFKGIQWINATNGELPAWVRPGVDWEPNV